MRFYKIYKPDTKRNQSKRKPSISRKRKIHQSKEIDKPKEITIKIFNQKLLSKKEIKSLFGNSHNIFPAKVCAYCGGTVFSGDVCINCINSIWIGK